MRLRYVRTKVKYKLKGCNSKNEALVHECKEKEKHQRNTRKEQGIEVGR